MTHLEQKKDRAQAWFQSLQNNLIEAFESLEETAANDDGAQASRFQREPWRRGDGASDLGGGIMAVLKGRVFEKAGIHSSNVYGEFSEEFRKQIPGAEDDPRFWASGISVIAHTANPHAPAAHMNTRMIVTTKCWFGGGGDLNPMLDRYRAEIDSARAHEDTKDFHAAYRAACDAHDPAYYPTFKKWCDEYFFLPHRNEPRGVGGVFYDRHDSGDWEKDFAFTQDIGRAFLDTYPQLVARRHHTQWTEEDRQEQLRRRGRYAEYNLLYDRGTTFGLKTGGNVDAILSSLPPLARWD